MVCNLTLIKCNIINDQQIPAALIHLGLSALSCNTFADLRNSSVKGRFGQSLVNNVIIIMKLLFVSISRELYISCPINGNVIILPVLAMF